MDESVALLQRLVRIPTENPPGNEYREVAALIGDLLAAAGYEVSSVEAEPGLFNVVGLLRGTVGYPTLLLNGHLDVVPAGEGWQHSPFAGHFDGERVYGRGAADMKGAVASMLTAAKRLAARRDKLRGNLLLAFTADEETGGHNGVKYLLDNSLLRADFAIVGEPTNFEVRSCQRGALWLEIEFHGRSAHGSLPHLGINAVEMAAEAVAALRRTEALQQAHPLLGVPTLSVNRISGGTKVNVIPNRCRIEIDRRMLPGEKAENVQREILSTINATRFPGSDVSVKQMIAAEPFELRGDQLRIAAFCRNSYERVTGCRPVSTGELSFTDARLLVHQANIPTVVFGPGLDSVCHITDEYIDVRDVITASEVYFDLVISALA
jgi:acetylornithine deacetylase/succinyl-diaminopimelate desuccinylase family protein